MALFAADREAPELDCEVVRIQVKDLSLHRPRQWGACWLALTLWDRLSLDRFWRARLRPSRQGTRWLDVLKALVCYQLIDPGSEWRLHRHWYRHSAMRDLLASPMGVIAADTLYRCLDKLLGHKRAFFSFLRERWETLFDARFDVLLYDLTSTFFEIETQYGRSDRVWIMDRGIPTEETLEAMRTGQAPVHYLVGTPKGRLTRLEKAFVGLPWREGRYLLRSNLTGEDPATLWRYYMQLSEIEQAFKELKHDLAIRPIFHRTQARIEAHIFVAFIAYCLHVTLKNLARPRAPGLTPRAILEKFSTLQMVDVHLPTADGRHLMLPRHTQPERDRQLLLDQLKLRLPEQPSPGIST